MTDRLTVRMISAGLILLALSTVVAFVWVLVAVSLTPEQRGQVLGVLGSIGTAALGAVAGLLAHTSSEAPADPVPEAPADPADPAAENWLEHAQPAE